MKNSFISVDMIYRSTFRLIHYTNIHFSHVSTHPLYIRHFVLLCSGFIILCLSNCEEIKTSQSLCKKDVKKLYVNFCKWHINCQKSCSCLYLKCFGIFICIHIHVFLLSWYVVFTYIYGIFIRFSYVVYIVFTYIFGIFIRFS